MFKLSAVSQIWKTYIQKLNDWDLPLSLKIWDVRIIIILDLTHISIDFLDCKKTQLILWLNSKELSLFFI